MRNPETLIIVDAQRGFMPATEGERLGLGGFGELGVNGGESIISPINRITTALTYTADWLIAATQDYHPAVTAHFADQPNYVDTWPPHCIGGTDGAELHPDLLIAQRPELAMRFIKGDEACDSPEDDDSYTGALAHNQKTGLILPDYLRQNGVKQVYVAGLALGDGDEHPLCVDSTARDLHRLGFEVSLVTNATEAVDPANRGRCFANLARIGITLVSSDDLIKQIEARQGQ